MDYFSSGQFWGETYQKNIFDGITATETEYHYKFIDWHYHENPYFTLGISGNCREINKRETVECSPDSLVFHNCYEPHSNAKLDNITRQFQIELSHDWCQRFEVNLEKIPNSLKILNPNIKLLFYNIYRESKLSDDISGLTIDSLLLEIFESISKIEATFGNSKPRWVIKIEEILHDNFDQHLSLQGLAEELEMHWVHISREFPRYFRCNFGEYIRKIRIEKSLTLLRNRNLSLTEIALMCGFADQSHYIRCFKEFNKITPKKFRQIISSR